MIKISRSDLTIIAGLSLLLVPNAFAQEGGKPEISVIAPQVVVQEGQKDTVGARVMVYSVSRPVSFADLDLRTVAGVDQFKQRIHVAAKQGCDQLSKERPLVKDDSCMKTAVANAMVQANQVIDAANER